MAISSHSKYVIPSPFSILYSQETKSSVQLCQSKATEHVKYVKRVIAGKGRTSTSYPFI